MAAAAVLMVAVPLFTCFRTERGSEAKMERMILIAYLFLLTKCSPILCAVPETDLFPFGPSAGDSRTPTADDSFSGPIILAQPIPFLNNTYNSIFVSTNGVFSFMKGLSAFTPVCGPSNAIMIAPYWADINQDQGLGGVTYFRETKNQALLDKATREIQSAFPNLHTSLRSLFIGTWYEAPFNWAKIICHKTNETVARNTFQGILATNGVQTFAIFYYTNITWTTGTYSGGNCSGLGGHPAKVGYDRGDGQTFYEVPASCTSDIIKMSETSNVGSPGKWIFQIDGGSQPVGGVCNGRGRCQCDAGYEGDDCSLETNWCQTPLSEIEGRPAANTVCGNRGSCYRTTAGAQCLCYAGFTGQFCDQLIPDQLTLSKRCVYNNSQTGCAKQQECVPDDLQCLLTPCKNATGWCLPNPRATSTQSINYPPFKTFPQIQPGKDSEFNSSSCSNRGHCVCDSGYTGTECESEIDWCSQPVQGFNNGTDLISSICANGKCLNSPSGATCVCNPGFTGPFCTKDLPDQTFLSRRCFAYAPSRFASTEIPVGCGPDQSCVPDNLQCLLSHCKNAIGWCLPLGEANMALFKNVLQKMNK